MKIKTVMVFGTFDIFHKGHENFLKQARLLGDKLVVVIARDKTVLRVKGGTPWNNEVQRKLAVLESDLADEVVLGSLKDKYEVIRNYKPDLIALGYDQEFFVDGLKEQLKAGKLPSFKISRLEAFFPEKYKSSKIKNQIITDLNKN